MDRRSGAIVLILGLFLAVGGPARADDPQFTLVIKEHRFEPPELQVPAGVKLRLLVKNEDPTPEEFESTELHREKVVPPGQQILVIVGPLDAGTYPFFGDFHHDTAQGKLIAK
ncbi:MAG TPA: cupredoxin domain-containing protein [Stellaceae bacterium]|nr:cupredoxin domain-containing protein [Stellaceae bacterium]